MDEDYARKLRAWLRAEPEATPRRAAEEREWLREVPQPGPAPDARRTAADDAPGRLPGSGESWSVRGNLPVDADDDWVCPVITLPVPRPSGENGCRLSEATDPARGVRRSGAEPAQPRTSEATDPARSPRQPDTEPSQPRMSEAEARSRWNHPTNWHRRRRAAERPDERGSR